MTKFTVLKIGQIFKFESSEVAITELINKGYKKVGEIEALDSKDAEARFNPKDAREDKDPSAYLSFMAMIYLIISLVGSCVLFFIGIKSYKSISLLYYCAAFGNLIVAFLIHSVCKTLIFISKK